MKQYAVNVKHSEAISSEIKERLSAFESHCCKLSLFQKLPPRIFGQKISRICMIFKKENVYLCMML